MCRVENKKGEAALPLLCFRNNTFPTPAFLFRDSDDRHNGHLDQKRFQEGPPDADLIDLSRSEWHPSSCGKGDNQLGSRWQESDPVDLEGRVLPFAASRYRPSRVHTPASAATEVVFLVGFHFPEIFAM